MEGKLAAPAATARGAAPGKTAEPVRNNASLYHSDQQCSDFEQGASMPFSLPGTLEATALLVAVVESTHLPRVKGYKSWLSITCIGHLCPRP